MSAATDMQRPLISVDDARARMLKGLAALPAEEVALADGLRRVVAERVVSKTTLPPWDNSAMDGFAVRAADVETANEAQPVSLRVIGEVAAGRAPSASVSPGTALRILTGAPLPEGADAVVPVEQTDAAPGVADLPEVVRVMSGVAEGAHIRRSGSDLRAEQILLEPGTPLGPQQLAVAAAGGHATLRVHRRPRVAVLATGDELVPAGSALGAAQIPDSNTPGLLAAALDAGAEARTLGIAHDNLGSVQRLLAQGLAWADVIVASGGVSVGAHDVVKDAFAALGSIDLWRIAVQPGKPLAFGRAPRPWRGRRRAALRLARQSCQQPGHLRALRATRAEASRRTRRCHWPRNCSCASRDGSNARPPAGAPSCACASSSRPTDGTRSSPAARNRTCSRRWRPLTGWQLSPSRPIRCPPAPMWRSFA